MFGPGKYDGVATELREKLDADGVLLIVINQHGESGASCKATPEAMKILTTALRGMADAMEADSKKLQTFLDSQGWRQN